MIQYLNYTDKLYDKKMASLYDRMVPSSLIERKDAFIRGSYLKKGMTVLIFCCGTGLELEEVIKKIGSEGRVVGIDLSEEMLKKAEERIGDKGWKNVELIKTDVTTFDWRDYLSIRADAGLFFAGLSILPDYWNSLCCFLESIQPKGIIMVGDMMLSGGLWFFLNLPALILIRKYGGSWKGHKNSLKLLSFLKENLNHVRYKQTLFGSYFLIEGIKSA